MAGFNNEWTLDTSNPFSEKLARKKFVSKVFLVVTTMMGFTFFLAFLPFMSETVANFYYLHYLWIFLVSFFCYLVTSFSIICCKCAQRNSPQKEILLVLLGLSLGLMISVKASTVTMPILLIAASSTILITVIIAFVARYAPCDITGWGLLLFVVSLFVLLYGIVTIIVSLFIPIPILSAVFAIIALILIIVYMWFNLQLIMGGRRHEIDTKDVVLASALLYIDIALLFYYLMVLIGGSFDSSSDD